MERVSGIHTWYPPQSIVQFCFELGGHRRDRDRRRKILIWAAGFQMALSLTDKAKHSWSLDEAEFKGGGNAEDTLPCHQQHLLREKRSTYPEAREVPRV
jgi:hypothetical protein